MTISRFNRRRQASRSPKAKTILRASIQRADLLHLDEIAQAVLECATGSKADVARNYTRIGDWLHANITYLDLDENTYQITDFAKRLAGELLPVEGRRLWFGSDSCWDEYWHASGTPYLYKKIDGINSPTTDEWNLRSVADQKVAMVDVALVVLQADATYHVGALALKKHQDANGLLPGKFTEYIEE